MPKYSKQERKGKRRFHREGLSVFTAKTGRPITGPLLGKKEAKRYYKKG